MIDTRERRVHVNGHWFGSTNIPLSVLAQQIHRLVPQKDFPIHILDWQDAPSDAAVSQLSELGYSKIERQATSEPSSYGQGFVKGEYVWSKAFGEVLAHTCGLKEITPAEYLAALYSWNSNDIDPAQIQPGVVETPIDQSALFAGRHHGNMQDSRDYLDWEEALPEQIDPLLHNTWLANLRQTPN